MEKVGHQDSSTSHFSDLGGNPKERMYVILKTAQKKSRMTHHLNNKMENQQDLVSEGREKHLE